MNIIQTGIEGLVVIEPKVFGDARGYFFEAFNQREFDEKVGPSGSSRTTRASRATGSCAGSISKKGSTPRRSSSVW